MKAADIQFEIEAREAAYQRQELVDFGVKVMLLKYIGNQTVGIG